MKMTVSPAEIAEHLTKEHGITQALEQVSYHLNRAKHQETRDVWSKVGSILDEKKSDLVILQ